MSTFISIFSFLALSFLVAYLIWKNDWLFGRLSESQQETAEARVKAAQREADLREEVAEREADLRSFQKVRELEIAVYNETKNRLESEVEKAKQLTAAEQRSLPSSSGGGFFSSLGGALDRLLQIAPELEII